MSIISFIQSNWDTVLAAGTLIASWLGISKSKAAEAKAKAALESTLKAAVYRALADASLHARVEAYLAGALTDGAKRLGIPAKVADALAPMLVEDALALFYQLLIEQQLAKLATSTQAVATTLKDQ